MLQYHNFDSCGLYYDFYNGKDVIECERCGKLHRKKSKKATNIKYCKDCARIVNIEKTIQNRKSV